MNHVIRTAHLQDLETINSLIKYSARIIQAQFYKESIIENALELVGNIETLIQQGNLFVVEFESRIIACGGISPCKTKPHQAEVKSFFVHPDFSRRGLATELLQVCEKQCLHTGIKFIYLTSTLAGEPFYQKCGFTESQRLQHPLSNGESFELVKMYKKL